jgi:hypothetical protein
MIPSWVAGGFAAVPRSREAASIITELQMRDVSVSAAVNDDSILNSCLAASPDIRSGLLELATYRGYSSAAEAINAALDAAGTKILAVAHQDVYLPANFTARLVKSLNALSATDPDWAVAGAIGIDAGRKIRGRTWASSMQRVLGSPDGLPAPVSSIDELLIVIRTESGLRLDPGLPSFHLYGTDLVQTALAHGGSAYVIDMPVIHHSRPVVPLGGGYRQAYRYLQRKWREKLPLPTLMGGVEASPLPLLVEDLRYRFRNRGRRGRPAPTGDPEEIARRIGFDRPITPDHEASITR